MKPLLTRRYLAENVEQAVLDAISDGKFGECLPGERRLSEMLGVSRPTLRLALAKLARQGVIHVEKGKRTRVKLPDTVTETGPVRQPDRVVMLSPYSLADFSSGTLLRFDLFRTKLEESGMFMEFRVCPWIAKLGQEVNLRNFTRHESPALWVLVSAHPEVQTWFAEQKLPCMTFGLPAPDVDIPGIDECMAETVSHAFARLRSAGHETLRIALINPDQDVPTHRACDRAFVEAGGLPQHIFKHPPTLPEMRKRIGEISARILACGITGVIVDWPDAVMLFLTHNGIVEGRAIPREMSLVALRGDYAFECMLPAVTRYDRSAERYASALLRLALQVVKGVSGKRKLLRVFPDFVSGATVEAPRA